MAISSRISSNELFSSEDEWRCRGELKPRPAASAPWRRRRALGRRRRFDWARFRRRDLENSFTACISAVSASQCQDRAGHPHRRGGPSPRVWGLDPHIFLAILVNGEVDGAEGAAADLLLD